METTRTKFEAANETEVDSFLKAATLELKRAERYRVFVSLAVLDLKSLALDSSDRLNSGLEQIILAARKNVRECDHISVQENRLSILFPETSRQGAEVAAKRVAELVRASIAERTGVLTEILPMELASYPDAAGARTVADFLKDYMERRQN